MWRPRPTFVPTTMLYASAAQWRRKGLLTQTHTSHGFLFESVLGEERPPARKVARRGVGTGLRPARTKLRLPGTTEATDTV